MAPFDLLSAQHDNTRFKYVLLADYMTVIWNEIGV